MKKDVAMKTVITVLMCILLVLSLLVPVGVIAAGSFGYAFRIFDITVYSLILCVLSVCVHVLSVIYKGEVGKFTECVSFILPTVSSVNALVSVICYPDSFFAVAPLAVIAAVCCFLTAYKYVKRLPLKIAAFALPVVLIVVAFISGTVIPMLRNTFFKVVPGEVIQTVDSPSGNYYAELIDDGQGALGGATKVWVYERGVDAGLFSAVKSPQEVYWGKWGEFNDMEIRWKDDDCLVINSTEYKIDHKD